MLLCANCHREIHNPELDSTNIQQLSIEANVNSFTKPFGTICPICNKQFAKIKGKLYCSKECRIKAQGKDKYPLKSEVLKKYDELGSWQKVADYYKLTRRIIQKIRE